MRALYTPPVLQAMPDSRDSQDTIGAALLLNPANTPAPADAAPVPPAAELPPAPAAGPPPSRIVALMRGSKDRTSKDRTSKDKSPKELHV